MAALSLARPDVATPDALNGFRIYLEQSKHNPFVINLENATLVEVVIAGANARSKFHPKYRENIGGLLHNLRKCSGHTNLNNFDKYIRDE